MRERDVLRQLAEQQREITSLRRALERALRYVPHGDERQRMLELVYRHDVLRARGDSDDVTGAS